MINAHSIIIDLRVAPTKVCCAHESTDIFQWMKNDEQQQQKYEGRHNRKVER